MLVLLQKMILQHSPCVHITNTLHFGTAGIKISVAFVAAVDQMCTLNQITQCTGHPALPPGLVATSVGLRTACPTAKDEKHFHAFVVGSI